ncbi:MAG TPA: hypothetical protein VG370_17795 [Chloroflexota bacterium]|nr:hypothetical protein [Chloroflexota bacterium]
MDEQLVPPSPSPARRGSSGWAWFFAGTTLAFGLLLAALLWALISTGLYVQLLGRIDPRADALWRGLAAATPAAGAPSRAVPPTWTPAPPTTRVEGTPPAAAASPIPPGPPTAQGTAATPTPAVPSAPAPAPPSASAATPARRGEIVSAGHWQLVVNDARSEPQPGGGRRLTLDLTFKNDSDEADVLSIPATVPQAPRARPAGDRSHESGYRQVQLVEPPAAQLRVLDRAGRAFGGGFVSANGESGGSFTFVAAPGDAIRLPYAFEVPASAADPLSLEAQFAQALGGAGFRIALDDAARPPAKLLPSDRAKVNGTEERYAVDGLWSLTLLGVDVGAPASNGERTVTARVSAENLTDRPLALGATLDDPTGGERDFYVVDAEARVAYSSGDTMPRQPIPPKATRTVEVRMKAHRDFASSGPRRFSIVVDPREQRFAIFRVG